MAISAYLNAIATAVPPFDVHAKFVDFAPRLIPEKREQRLFGRMVSRAHIDHRHSFLEPHENATELDKQGFYDMERGFPSTRERMGLYEKFAFPLAQRALDQLDLVGTTHLIVTTCTGFYAPGLDYQILRHYELAPGVERCTIGFMGCFAAINGLKLARHLVRSEPDARVLLVNLELCTLHLQSTGSLEEMLSYLIFADGCAASIVSSQEEGIELQRFDTVCLPETNDLITWRVGDTGFDMHLSGQVPGVIATHLPNHLENILGGLRPNDVDHWAIHPGGRSVLDAVKEGASLDESQMLHSRDVLRRFGNMSSATVMFVLKEIMADGSRGLGCALAFGPGLTVESMGFQI